MLINIHDDDGVIKFINIIKESEHLNFLYEKENKLYVNLKYLFNKYKVYEDENIGFLPFNV
jgi:hypothetical protein